MTKRRNGNIFQFFKSDKEISVGSDEGLQFLSSNQEIQLMFRRHMGKSCAVLCVTIVARQILALSIAVLVLGHLG